MLSNETRRAAASQCLWWLDSSIAMMVDSRRSQMRRHLAEARAPAEIVWIPATRVTVWRMHEFWGNCRGVGVPRFAELAVQCREAELAEKIGLVKKMPGKRRATQLKRYLAFVWAPVAASHSRFDSYLRFAFWLASAAPEVVCNDALLIAAIGAFAVGGELLEQEPWHARLPAN